MITPFLEQLLKGFNHAWVPLLNDDTFLVNIAVPPFVAGLEIGSRIVRASGAALASATGTMVPMEV